MNSCGSPQRTCKSLFPTWTRRAEGHCSSFGERDILHNEILLKQAPTTYSIAFPMFQQALYQYGCSNTKILFWPRNDPIVEFTTFQT